LKPFLYSIVDMGAKLMEQPYSSLEFPRVISYITGLLQYERLPVGAEAARTETSSDGYSESGRVEKET
jgi:hypothetical protein